MQKSHESATSGFSTKQDILDLRKDIDAKFEAMENRFDAKFEAQRKDSELLRKDIDAKFEAQRKDTVAMEDRFDAKFEAQRKDSETLKRDIIIIAQPNYAWNGKPLHRYGARYLDQAVGKEQLWTNAFTFTMDRPS